MPQQPLGLQPLGPLLTRPGSGELDCTQVWRCVGPAVVPCNMRVGHAGGVWTVITLELCFLPSYAEQRENPAEKVWWRMRQQVTANRLFGSVDVLISAVHEFFDSHSTEAAPQLTA